METEQTTWRHRFRWLVQMISSGESVAIAPAAALGVKSKVTLDLRHPRNGTYFVGLSFSYSLPMPVQTYDFGARLKLDFRGRKKSFSRIVGEAPSPYWNGPGESGFTFLFYEVPDDVERESALSIEVLEPAVGGFYSSEIGQWFVSPYVGK